MWDSESCTLIARGTGKPLGVAKDRVTKARATGARNHPQNATTCDRDVTKYPKSQVVMVNRNCVKPEDLGCLRRVHFESSASAIPPLRLSHYAPIVCGRSRLLSRGGFSCCVQDARKEKMGAVGSAALHL